MQTQYRDLREREAFLIPGDGKGRPNLTDIQLRSKEEKAAWTAIKQSFTRHQSETIERVQRRQQLQTATAETGEQSAPDLNRAKPWLVDVLNMAEDLIKAGPGELAGMGEFADVEYKVSAQ